MNYSNKGIYQHYKGQYYEFLTTAQRLETLEWIVVYQALYGDLRFWGRPLTTFIEQIKINNEKFRVLSLL
ncbi:MAG: DUF1653 domain-containing protein [Janthinobacterium lividum]